MNPILILRSLVLALTGWLVYGLTRGLLAVILLDTPTFDWQWYPPVTLLIILLPLYIVLHKLRNRIVHLLIAGSLVWAVLGFNGFGQALDLSPNRYPAVPLSFWAYGYFDEIPESILKDLKSTGGHIYLALDEHPFSGETGQHLINGLQRLANDDIDVYLVPYASEFLSVPYHDEWIMNAGETAQFLQQEKLENVRGLTGDAERPLKMGIDLLELDRPQFVQAGQVLHTLVQEIHQTYPGLSIGVTANWHLFLDRLDEDADLSIVERSMVDPPGNWDFSIAMTYSSYLPVSWRPYYVYIINRAISHLYPEKPPARLIGLVGGGFPGEPLLDFEGLVQDTRIGRAVGAREIVVFQLNGALQVFGEDFVGRLNTAVNNPAPNTVVIVPFSRPASLIFFGTMVADALLDIRGWPGILLLIWLSASILLRYYLD
ncbi:MAG: hypothetical protein HY326_05905 [Chloroflexi bacterium]|nr:hypothetical protein [Chloroflexota bacterium]